MAEYLLQNYAVVGKLLRYDGARGLAVEIDESGDEEVSEGLYVDPGRDLGGRRAEGARGATGTFAGYYETDDGPVFFRDSERWLLHHGRARADILRSDSGYTFVLWDGEARCIDIEYPGPLPENVFFPQDEEYRDPFQWVARYLPEAGFYCCRVTLTLEDARRLLHEEAEDGPPAALERHLARLREGPAERSILLREAWAMLVEQGRVEEQDLAVRVLVDTGAGISLLRRLARTYAARGWEGSHPAVRLFLRFRDQLGDGGRAVLRRCLRTDSARHAALADVLAPRSDG